MSRSAELRARIKSLRKHCDSLAQQTSSLCETFGPVPPSGTGSSRVVHHASQSSQNPAIARVSAPADSSSAPVNGSTTDDATALQMILMWADTVRSAPPATLSAFTPVIQAVHRAIYAPPSRAQKPVPSGLQSFMTPAEVASAGRISKGSSFHLASSAGASGGSRSFGPRPASTGGDDDDDDTIDDSSFFTKDGANASGGAGGSFNALTADASASEMPGADALDGFSDADDEDEPVKPTTNPAAKLSFTTAAAGAKAVSASRDTSDEGKDSRSNGAAMPMTPQPARLPAAGAQAGSSTGSSPDGPARPNAGRAPTVAANVLTEAILGVVPGSARFHLGRWVSDAPADATVDELFDLEDFADAPLKNTALYDASGEPGAAAHGTHSGDASLPSSADGTPMRPLRADAAAAAAGGDLPPGAGVSIAVQRPGLLRITAPENPALRDELMNMVRAQGGRGNRQRRGSINAVPAADDDDEDETFNAIDAIEDFSPEAGGAAGAAVAPGGRQSARGPLLPVKPVDAADADEQHAHELDDLNLSAAVLAQDLVSTRSDGAASFSGSRARRPLIDMDDIRDMSEHEDNVTVDDDRDRQRPAPGGRHHAGGAGGALTPGQAGGAHRFHGLRPANGSQRSRTTSYTIGTGAHQAGYPANIDHVESTTSASGHGPGASHSQQPSEFESDSLSFAEPAQTPQRGSSIAARPDAAAGSASPGGGRHVTRQKRQHSMDSLPRGSATFSAADLRAHAGLNLHIADADALFDVLGGDDHDNDAASQGLKDQRIARAKRDSQESQAKGSNAELAPLMGTGALAKAKAFPCKNSDGRNYVNGASAMKVEERGAKRELFEFGYAVRAGGTDAPSALTMWLPVAEACRERQKHYDGLVRFATADTVDTSSRDTSSRDATPEKNDKAQSAVRVAAVRAELSRDTAANTAIAVAVTKSMMDLVQSVTGSKPA